MNRHLILAFLGLATLGTGARPATAQSSTAEAEQLFRDGKKLMAAGDYARACEAFEGSARQDPLASTLVNLADCREKNQQYASAWSAFLQAARIARGQAALDPLRKVAEDRANALEPRLSYLVINVATDAEVDGLIIKRNGDPIDPATWNRDIPVDGGTYVIAGKAPGYAPWSTTVTVHAAEDKQSVNVPRFASVPATDGQPDDNGGGDHDTDPSGPRESRFTGKRKVAVGAWAAGAVGLGAGLALELKSGGTYDDAKADHDNAQRHALTSQANRERTYATIAAGAGAAAVAVGIYLWLDGKPRRRHEVALVPAIGDGSVAATLAGSF